MVVFRIYFQMYEKTIKLKPDVLRFVSGEYFLKIVAQKKLTMERKKTSGSLRKQSNH